MHHGAVDLELIALLHDEIVFFEESLCGLTSLNVEPRNSGNSSGAFQLAINCGSRTFPRILWSAVKVIYVTVRL